MVADPRPIQTSRQARPFVSVRAVKRRDGFRQCRKASFGATKTSSTRDYQFLYDFDSNGNRTRKFEGGALTAYTYGDSNEMLTAGSDTFTWDHFLNMKTKVSGGNTTTYNWDFESNLTSVDYPNTANDDIHEYDAMGRRMRSKLNGAANWTNFIWDEDAGTLVAEYTLISSTFALTSENTWGLGLISTNRAGTKRYFHFDGSGNTIALTDTSESVTDTYGYTESGQAVTSLDSGTSTNPFRWQGMGGAYDDGAMGSLGGLVWRHRSGDFSASINAYLPRQNGISQEQRDRCAEQYTECLRIVDRNFTLCLTGGASVNLLCSLCFLLTGPPLIAACLIACGVVVTGGTLAGCTATYENAVANCKLDREWCLKPPPGPPSIYEKCMNSYMFHCTVVQGGSQKDCLDFCRLGCMPFGFGQVVSS